MKELGRSNLNCSRFKSAFIFNIQDSHLHHLKMFTTEIYKKKKKKKKNNNKTLCLLPNGNQTGDVFRRQFNSYLCVLNFYFFFILLQSLVKFTSINQNEYKIKVKMYFFF